MKRLFDVLDSGVAAVVAMLFSGALLLSLVGVAGRYISALESLDWIGEVVIYLSIWAVLLGAARVMRRAAHIRVDFLADRMPPKIRTGVELMSLALAAALSVFLVWSGWLVVDEAMMWDERSVSTLRMPLWMYYAALPASFALQMIFLTERALDLVSGRGAAVSAELTD